MSGSGVGHALGIERSCALVACALSEGRREGARLLSGERRGFGLSPNRTVVHVPYPTLAADWTLRSLTCGVALQCAPSKDRIARHPLHELPRRLLQALTIVEAAVALGWIESRWPGLLPEFERLVPSMDVIRDELDGAAMLDRADALARSDRELRYHPLLGCLPLDSRAQRSLLASFRRMYGQMPWSSKRTLLRALHTIPVGGQGGVLNPNTPPSSRPDDEDGDIRTDRDWPRPRSAFSRRCAARARSPTACGSWQQRP